MRWISSGGEDLGIKPDDAEAGVRMLGRSVSRNSINALKRSAMPPFQDPYASFPVDG